MTFSSTFRPGIAARNSCASAGCPRGALAADGPAILELGEASVEVGPHASLVDERVKPWLDNGDRPRRKKCDLHSTGS